MPCALLTRHFDTFWYTRVCHTPEGEVRAYRSFQEGKSTPYSLTPSSGIMYFNSVLKLEGVYIVQVLVEADDAPFLNLPVLLPPFKGTVVTVNTLVNTPATIRLALVSQISVRQTELLSNSYPVPSEFDFLLTIHSWYMV